MSVARQQKINVQHQLLLTEQLVATDNEIKATLKVAEHQAEVEKNVDAIKAEIETQDQHITQMQKHFKEAENLLVIIPKHHSILTQNHNIINFTGNSIISSKTKITVN